MAKVLVDHEQLLHVRLESNKWPKPLFVTAVYAKCDTVERRELWDAPRAASVGASPWIVGGDFNTVLSPDERSGGAAPSGITMSDFHDAIADCALVDAGYVGSPYTWYSRRLRQRLDRVLISSCWMTIFPKMQVAHLELSQSDHRGLLVEAECTVGRKVSSFHFQHMWTTHSEFLGVVRRKELAVPDAAERGLKEADEAYDQDPCDRTLVERNRCSAELVRVLAQEEAFWRQKAGIRWAKDGERNTRYFHSLVQKQRFGAASNSRAGIPGGDGWPGWVWGSLFSYLLEIIAEDVFGAVTEFFHGEKMPKGFTAIAISLIPKTASPTCWSEYRPISLCNVTNKICMKLMTIRLGHVLPKAYDRVSWSSLSSLAAKGFPTTLDWLGANAISHCWFSVLVNGEHAGFFHSTHGLRQGDPLSPALFVLAADYLSRGLERLFAARPTMFYQAPGLIWVSHLAYADDLMIFTTTCRENMELLRDFLRAYERGLGPID
ncbi:UNVERIFIED_CONTAM: hypothetical protein Scaly_3134600 [Sesamum calycinum]|uniref:Reverse transcriptase domain-containing protein n=1 Tax=Sesamum calycinum TaxID=2727403 RepID=A0AAW2JGV8_9LAMI